MGVFCVKRLLYLSLGLILACVVVWAQASTAQIHGVVQDSSGAAVPGAEVKAIQTETGVSRTVTSAADGRYVLTNRPIGPYRLEIAKDGFTKYAQSGIELQVNSDPREEHPVPKFAPRLGFAWDPTGSGKTSVRSSFSYGYAFLPGLTREDQQGSNPWGGRETVTILESIRECRGESIPLRGDSERQVYA